MTSVAEMTAALHYYVCRPSPSGFPPTKNKLITLLYKAKLNIIFQENIPPQINYSKQSRSSYFKHFFNGSSYKIGALSGWVG